MANKIKKVAFKEIVNEFLKEELEMNQEMHDDGDDYSEEEFQDGQKSVTEDFNNVKNLNDLVNILTNGGFRESEAYELIINKLIKFPK